jgi:hypothetical protein
VGALSLFVVGVTETVWLAVNTRLLFVTFAALYYAHLAAAQPELAALPQWRWPSLLARPIGLRREHHP